MTREEAISLLTQVNKILVNSNSWLENTHEPLNMAFDMAIKALEQEPCEDAKKQEICEYCHEDSDGYVMPLEKNSHAFICFGMDGWELSLRAKGWHGSTKIKYCPMCGRELKNG